jgi:succinate dehydrogenase / fumarate reductase cytochrome b subunit
MDAETRHFLLRRLHSLTGIVPIGVFLLEHFYTNAKAQYGAEAFNQAERELWGMPYLWVAEIALIALPILFHGIYGFFITYEGNTFRPAPGYQTRYRNVAYVLQRVTGVVVFAFIGYHVWHTRLQWALGGPEPDFDYMKEYFAPGGIKALYVVGILCACYHFANGLFNVAYKWGITVSARSQERLAAASVVVFLALSAVGIHILFAFR